MEPTKRKRRTWRAGVGMIAVALVVVTIWRAWPRERLLIEVARPIVKVEPEWSNYSDPENEETYWLTSNQLLIVTPDQNNRDRDRHDLYGNYAQKTWQGSADILNTKTHTRSHLSALTDLIERTTVRPMWRPDRFELSPDGTWIQWQTYSGSDGWPLPRAARLDGTHYREWFRDKRGQENFFLDSRHICQIEANAQPSMKVRDLQSPNQDKKCSTPEQTDAVLAQYALHQPLYIDVPAFDDEGASGEVEVDTYRMQARLQLRLSSWGRAHQSPKPLLVKKIVLPTGAKLRSGGISPQQQSLCFDLHMSRTPPLFDWLHRIIPAFAIRPAVTTETLWMSRTDGAGMHEIGYVPAPLDENGDQAQQIRHLEWLPDGKQISFIYRDTLYVVPAVPEK